MDMDYLVEEVRATLQDFPELNHILLEGDREKEHSDDEIERSIRRSLANINMKPPQTRYTLKNFPNLKEFNWKLIVDGAIIEALKVKGILKVRNEMNYQDQGGVSVRLEGKGQNYLQMVNNFYQNWHEQLMDFKEGISVRRAWGGVRSPYSRQRW